MIQLHLAPKHPSAARPADRRATRHPAPPPDADTRRSQKRRVSARCAAPRLTLSRSAAYLTRFRRSPGRRGLSHAPPNEIILSGELFVGSITLGGADKPRFLGRRRLKARRRSPPLWPPPAHAPTAHNNVERFNNVQRRLRPEALTCAQCSLISAPLCVTWDRIGGGPGRPVASSDLAPGVGRRAPASQAPLTWFGARWMVQISEDE